MADGNEKEGVSCTAADCAWQTRLSHIFLITGPGCMAVLADTDAGPIVTTAQSEARWGVPVTLATDRADPSSLSGPGTYCASGLVHRRLLPAPMSLQRREKAMLVSIHVTLHNGWTRDNSDSAQFFDKQNSYRGFYDESTGTMFDSHDNVKGQWMGGPTGGDL